MILFNLEYMTENDTTYNCKILCRDRNCIQDEIKEISNIVGKVKVLSVHQIGNVHRISKTIKEDLVKSLNMDSPKKKIGRPKKYIIL